MHDGESGSGQGGQPLARKDFQSHSSGDVSKPDRRSLASVVSRLLEDPAVQWVVLISASFLVLFAQATHSGLRGDSIFYAALARRIADSGEYGTLRFGQELNHHGPLVFWLTAFAIKLFGPTPFAATLVSRLFGLGCIVLTAVLGGHLVSKTVGWIAALALLTSYVFFRNAVAVRLETALMFGILLALFGYFCGKRSCNLFYKIVNSSAPQTTSVLSPSWSSRRTPKC